jgi:hypothetical protein
MKELTHFIGGKPVNGKSGRFGDGFEPMAGEVISHVPFASKRECAPLRICSRPGGLNPNRVSTAARPRLHEIPRTRRQ